MDPAVTPWLGRAWVRRGAVSTPAYNGPAQRGHRRSGALPCFPRLLSSPLLSAPGLFLLALPCTAQIGRVLGEQKINMPQGGFTGPLADRDRFGFFVEENALDVVIEE